jgi:hypothetical protein
MASIVAFSIVKHSFIGMFSLNFEISLEKYFVEFPIKKTSTTLFKKFLA